MKEGHAGDGPAPVWVAVVLTLLALGLGYMVKEPCTRHAWQDEFQYRRLCYNDLQPLFHVREISKASVPYRDVQVEYPVLTGSFMDLSGRLLRLLGRAGLVENSDPHYFRLSAILLAPFALITTLKLRPMVPARRLLIWAIGPPLVLYAFHNWDLLAVGAATWGLAALERDRHAGAGVAFALGASSKLYPLFLLPGAVLARFDDRRASVRLVVGFVLTALAVNLPWMIFAWDGWLGVWTFHATRYPDFGTVWYWIAHHARGLFPSAWWEPGQTGFRDLVSMMSLLLFGAGSALQLFLGWRRRERDGYPVAAVGLGILSIFLLVSKVHSPQYALWLLPLIALLNVPVWMLIVYLVGDAAVFASGFLWFTVLDEPAPGWKGVFEASVFVRAAALGALAWWATKARRVKAGSFFATS